MEGGKKEERKGEDGEKISPMGRRLRAIELGGCEQGCVFQIYRGTVLLSSALWQLTCTYYFLKTWLYHSWRETKDFLLKKEKNDWGSSHIV